MQGGNTGNVKSEYPRRFDIDWLRIIAVMLLFTFHSARIFDIWERFYAKSPQVSTLISHIFIGLVVPWHMPLLFLLAGVSSWFSLRYRRSSVKYVKERLKRLLLPFFFGLLVILPPQSYFGLRTYSGYVEGFWRYYPQFFRIIPEDLDGYFLGGFTPGHLWFIFCLFFFSMFALPVFRFFQGETGKKIIVIMAKLAQSRWGLLWFAIPIIITNRLPSPAGLNLALYFTIFFYGYILMTDELFEKMIDRDKRVGLLIGPVLMFITRLAMIFGPPSLFPVIARLYYSGIFTWFCLIALLGYGRRYLNFNNKLLDYLREASYPIYILHQTVIIMVGFYVVRWSTGIFPQFVIIVCASVAITFLIYDLLVKRTNLTRFFFGMKPIKGNRKN